ncbi:MAG: chemotaxis protein CheW [Limnobacter sp.]|uniref:chemotaxis protein CheW n=1 Tax=Limnobacter sp. TaxID=2003368 RepID=UPI0022C56A96|nr:chemotaxis protein CheW [Limnobacter sp.]MCZ8014768.1 chemotaxis protein CheW [Limnobacter sp.]
MNLNNTDSDEVFGAFRLGSMALALPMTVLREVVPFTRLQQLPTAAPWVLGGLDLRGVLVPVVDLSVLLGHTDQADHRQCVVIVAHDGHLAGVVATAVDCLFSASTQKLNVFHGTDPVGRVARGSLQNPVSGKLLTVLCAQALMALPQLPAVSDPEPHRQSHALSQEHASAEEHHRIPLLLMRSRGLLFAVNPEEIETTMPRAQLKSKDVCNGHYKGNAIYREREIPAISLTDYLNFGVEAGPLKTNMCVGDPAQPAFVLRFGQGAMAVLIDEILDIVQVNPNQLIDLPNIAVLKTKVLRQTIAVHSIYPEQPHDEHFYVIHPKGMVADQGLKALADLVHRAENTKDVPEESDHQRKGLRRLEVDQRVIVFDMNGDHVIPISEIAEVLPYRGVKEAFPRDNPFRGIMTHRNRAIPVVDLAQHLGLPRQKLNTSSNVLVVHLENQPIGLAVGCLRSIEQANWSPEVPVLGAARTERSGVNKLTKKLAEVLVGNERKLLEIISAREEAQRFAECHLAARCDQTALSPEQEKQLECTHTAEA